MIQRTFSDIEYSNRRKKTRREEFLNYMDELIPWSRWVKMIRPYYPAGKRGRKPRDIEVMLRMYLMQRWFQLSSAALEDAIYDSYAMRNFMHLDFLKEQVPGASTLSRFKHLLAENGIDGLVMTDIEERLAAEGLVLRCGTIADAAVVRAGRSQEV